MARIDAGRPRVAHEPRRKESIQTRNALVIVERGGAGKILRIERPGEYREYAGPVPEETLNNLRIVAGAGGGG